MASLPISRTNLAVELANTRSLVERWEKVIKNENEVPDGYHSGLPALDYPANEDTFRLTMAEMANELALASSKLAALSELIERSIS